MRDMTAQWRRADVSTPFLQQVDPQGGADVSLFPVWCPLSYRGSPARAIVAWKNTQSSGLSHAMRAVWLLSLRSLIRRSSVHDIFPALDMRRYVAVVPIPSRWQRKHEGKMIVLDLAQEVAEVLDLPCQEVLKKRGTKLRDGRAVALTWANLKAGFATLAGVKRPYSVETFGGRARKRNSIKATRSLHGWDVILVDDVVTTGATFDAAFRAVRNAGGRVIGGFALAAAVDPRISPVA